MAQSRILLLWYGAAYLFLEINKPKYQQLEPPFLHRNQSHVKLEELNFESVDQPLELSKQKLKSPEMDLIGPFILEGL